MDEAENVEAYWVQVIGFAFACISYYAGVALISLPIPHRGMKEAGRSLVVEGGVTAVVMATLPMVPSLVNLISIMLYGEGAIDAAYENLYVWFSQTATYCTLTNTVIAINVALIAKLDALITWFLPGIGFFGNLASQLSDVLEPWVGVITGIHIFSELLKRVALIIQANWLSLLFLGALLFAIPKGITRGAGLSIITTAVTYYLAFPLLPTFVGVLSPPLLEQVVPVTINPWDYGIGGIRASVSKEQMQAIANDVLAMALAQSNQIIIFFWSRVSLTILYLGIIRIMAAGMSRVLGGRVPWSITSFTGV